MNFAALKEFKRKITTGIDDVANYLAVELAATIRELRAGMTKFRFEDNFESYIVNVTIAANTEQQIANRLDFIPSQFIVVMKNEGGIYIAKGGTAWTLEYLYLKNYHGSLTAIITVIFLR